MGKLRIEEPLSLPKGAEQAYGRVELANEHGLTPAGEAAKKFLTPKPSLADVTNVDHWRTMARDTAERLSYAEAQAKDLRTAADESRARMTKYKNRLDSANAQINELHVQLVKVTAERDDLKSKNSTETEALRVQLARQSELSLKVNEYRRSLLEGPLWDLVVELAVSPQPAGVEQK